MSVIFCGFISHLIGRETINIPEIFSGVHGFTGKTVKGFFLRHGVVFVLFCVAIVISEPFFAGAYIRPDFAAFGRKNFGSIFLVKSETETREIHF